MVIPEAFFVLSSVVGVLVGIAAVWSVVVHSSLWLYFPWFLHTTFPVGPLVIFGLACAFCYVAFFILAREVTNKEYIDKDAPGQLTHSDTAETCRGLLISLAFFLFIAWRIGAVDAAGRGWPIGGTVLYSILYIIVPAWWAGKLTFWAPAFIAGWVSLRTATPVSAVAERSASRKLPDRLIARELAAVLEAQELDDARAERLFTELSPLRQWVWRTRYAKRRREAARVRELAAAQTKAIAEETGLARETFELERARRARYHG